MSLNVIKCRKMSKNVTEMLGKGYLTSESDRTTSYTARLRSRQVAGVGAGPESHGGGVNGFVRVGMGGYIVE